MNVVVDPTRGPNSPHERIGREVDSSNDGDFDDALARAGASESPSGRAYRGDAPARRSEPRSPQPSSRDGEPALRGGAAKPPVRTDPSANEAPAEASATSEDSEPLVRASSSNASANIPSGPFAGVVREPTTSEPAGEGGDADDETPTELDQLVPSSTEPYAPLAVGLAAVPLPVAPSSKESSNGVGSVPSPVDRNWARSPVKFEDPRVDPSTVRAQAGGRGAVEQVPTSMEVGGTSPSRSEPVSNGRSPSVPTLDDVSRASARDAMSASSPGAASGFAITAHGYDVASDPIGLRPEMLLRDLVARADMPVFSAPERTRAAEPDLAKGHELRVESPAPRDSSRETPDQQLGDSPRQGRSSSDAQVEPRVADAAVASPDGQRVPEVASQGFTARPLDASALEAATRPTREALPGPDVRRAERQEAVELDVNRMTLRHGLRATADLGDLGRVEVDARFSGGIVELGLRAAEAETRALLHASRSQLQAELESSSEFEHTRLRLGRLEIGALSDAAPRAALPPVDPAHEPRGWSDPVPRDGNSTAYGEAPADRRGSDPHHADTRRDDDVEGRIHSSASAPAGAHPRTLDPRNTASGGRVRIVL